MIRNAFKEDFLIRPKKIKKKKESAFFSEAGNKNREIKQILNVSRLKYLIINIASRDDWVQFSIKTLFFFVKLCHLPKVFIFILKSTLSKFRER